MVFASHRLFARSLYAVSLTAGLGAIGATVPACGAGGEVSDPQFVAEDGVGGATLTDGTAGQGGSTSSGKAGGKAGAGGARPGGAAGSAGEDGGEGGEGGAGGEASDGGAAGAAGKAGGAAGKAGAGGKAQGGAGAAGATAGGGQAGDGGAAGAGGGALGAPYPIVLAHGFFGFEEFAGVDFVTYFYKVKDHLNGKGEAEVFTPAVDPFNSSDFRGEMLLAAVEKIVAETGREKVNIIGHSQGGLDARYVAHKRPDLVASVTTIATPHKGTRVADVALEVVPDQNLQGLLDALVNLVGIPLYDAAGKQTSLFTSFEQFSSEGIAKFNAEITDAPGVQYRSLAGRSKLAKAAQECSTIFAPPFIKKYDDKLDTLEPLLSIPGLIVDEGFIDKKPHDGLVAVESAKWGKFLGCVPADHFDEIGHLFGDSPGIGNSFEHLELYADLVALLRAEGL